MRIAVIAFSCLPDSGSEPGAGWHFAVAAERFARTRGGCVDLYVRRGDIDAILRGLRALDAGQDQVINVRPVRVPLHLTPSQRYTRSMSLLWLLAVRIRMILTSYQVIHHVTYASENIPPLVFLARRGSRCVWGPVGSAYDGASLPSPGRFFFRKCQAITNEIVRRSADVVVAQSADTAARFRTMVATRTEPNIVVPTALREEAIRRGALQRGNRQIVVCGQLIPRKRPELAVEILALVLKRLPEAQLLFVGDGELRGQLVALSERLGISHAITFLGAQSREETMRWMLGSRVLLHTSRREGAPWVVGEAITLGVPVVCYARTGADALLQHCKGVGHIVEGEDHTLDAAEAVLDFLRCDRGSPRADLDENRILALLEDWYQGPI